MPFLDLPDDNYLDDDRPDEDDVTRCEACGVDLDNHDCLCGPAGPCIGGVWTGDNSKAGPADLDNRP